MIDDHVYNEHLDIPPLELHYLDWIQNIFDFKKISGAVATIERIDEREVVFGLRHRSGSSEVIISRNILRFVLLSQYASWLAVNIANELISRFNQAVASKEDDLTIAPMMERAEKTGYRAAFTVIDEWSDSYTNGISKEVKKGVL